MSAGSDGREASAPAVRPLRRSDPTHIGGYRVVGRVGAGGMGMAYLAADSSDRQVVVKTLRDEWLDDPGFMARFAREADSLAKVRDARVVRVLDRDLEHDPPYLVTEYLPGPTLRQRVTNGGPLPPDEVRVLARELAHAVVAMHQAGLAHRDLTPANVIMGPSGPCIIDFGLAKDAHGAGTDRSTLIGTPGWVAPEGLMGQPVGPPADVFLWGELVVFAATGRAPFGEDGFDPSAQRTLYGQPDLDGLAQDLLGMVHAALSRDPAARPPAWHLAAWLGPPPEPEKPPAGKLKPASAPLPDRQPTTSATERPPDRAPAADVTQVTPPVVAQPRTPSLWKRSPAVRLTTYGAGLGFLSALVYGLTASLLLTFERDNGAGVAYRILGGFQEVLPFALAMALLAAIALGPRRTWWHNVSRVLPATLVLSVVSSLLWGWFGSQLFDVYAPRAAGLMVPAAFTASIAVALVIRSLLIGLAALAATMLTAPVAGWLVTGLNVPYEVYQVIYGAAIAGALALIGYSRRRRLAQRDQPYAQWGPSGGGADAGGVAQNPNQAQRN